MKMSRWGDEKTFLFIKNYRDHRCLWDSKCFTYRNKYAREKAYASILEALNDPKLTIPTVKMKIRSLRSTYCQEVKKIRDAANAGASYSPSLSWFNEMDALMTHNKDLEEMEPEALSDQGINTTVIESPQIETSVEFENQSDDDETNLIPLTKMNKKPIAIQHKNRQVVENKFVLNKRRNFRTKPYAITARRLQNFGETQRNSSISKPTVLNSATVIEDEFYYFGLNIAAQLRTLPLRLALQAQRKIQDNIYQARIHGEADFDGNPAHTDSNPLEMTSEDEEMNTLKYEHES